MALNFSSGNVDGVNCFDIDALDGLVTLTLSVWVRITALSDYQHVIDKGPSTGTHWGMQSDGAGNNNDVIVNAKNGGTDATQFGITTTNILSVDGLFHHWCMVYNGGGATNADRLKFYFDGVQQTLTYFGTIPATLASNANNLFLGMAEWDAGFELNGALDDVRTYNRVLTDAEVETLFACRGHDGIYTGLINRYKMDYEPPATQISYPTVASITETSFAANSTTHNVSMPATVNENDRLVMMIAVESATFGTTPTGWSVIGPTTNATCTYAIYTKLADGTEGGTTVNVPTNVGSNGAGQVYRITNNFVGPGVVTSGAVTGTSVNPNPPSLGPSGGPEAWLWLASTGGADDDATVSVYPAGFTNGTDTQSGGGANNSAEVGSARLNQSSQPVNPGTFTLSDSEAWVARTLAIRPRAWAIDVASANDGVPVNGPIYEEGTLSKKRRFI